MTDNIRQLIILSSMAFLLLTISLSMLSFASIEDLRKIIKEKVFWITKDEMKCFEKKTYWGLKIYDFIHTILLPIMVFRLVASLDNYFYLDMDFIYLLIIALLLYIPTYHICKLPLKLILLIKNTRN